jgi:DnaJ-class molecular chaperone
MDYERGYMNLGRQGWLSCAVGTWPGGEAAGVRDAYDDMIRHRNYATTKVCYNCHGSGKVSGQECTRCHGSGSVPAA